MTGQSETKAEPPQKRPFQFGLKHLLAVLSVLAASFGAGAWLELPIWHTLVAVSAVTLLCVTAIQSLRRFQRRLQANPVATLTELGVVVAIIATISVFLPHALDVAEHAAERSHCCNNLKCIGLAMQRYHDECGSFPPAYIADENGRPMHSWRVLILPYLDHELLYRQYDFDEPWNGPNNSKLAKQYPWIHQCPKEGRMQTPWTSYVAVTGLGTAWPDAESAKLDDFSDDLSNTLLVVEVANSGIHWMEPRDLHVVQMAPGINPAAGQGISSRHEGGANVALADGGFRFLPETISPEELRAMLTIDGGEEVDVP